MDSNLNVAPEVVDLDDADLLQEADLTMIINGRPSTWVWTFAGPGHDVTVAYNNRQAKRQIHEDALKEQAIVNRKKWIADEPSVDERREENVEWVLARLLRWSPVRLGGQDYPFTRENAKKVLLDPNKPFYNQALEFLTGERAFIKRSATA